MNRTNLVEMTMQKPPTFYAWQRLAIVSLAAILATILGCTPPTHKKGGESLVGELDEGNGGGGRAPAAVIKPVGPTAGIRNFESMYANMLAITGVSRASCMNDYIAQRPSLPEFHDIGSFGAAAQSALLKLAGCVCRQAISNNQNGGRARLTPNFPYNTNASAVADADFQRAAESLITLAWGPAELAHLPDRTMTVAKLVALARNIRTDDANANSTAATARIAFGLCTAVLSAPSAQML